jgi:hypothetical protein
LMNPVSSTSPSPGDVRLTGTTHCFTDSFTDSAQPGLWPA